MLLLTELQRPLTHRLMSDQDPSGGQHLLDHKQAERKLELQPDGMADHFSREAVTGIVGMTVFFIPYIYLIPVTPG